MPNFVPGPSLPTTSLSSPIAWFAFRGMDLLVRDPVDSPLASIPIMADLSDIGLRPLRTQVIGQLDGHPACSAELEPDAILPAGYACLSLRRLFGRLDLDLFDVAGTAFQVQYWDKTHRVCSACAAPLEWPSKERRKHCPRCGLDYFPKVHPAIIVLVEDGPHILMTRQARFPKGMYGLVAGFLDPGETLEQCVAREVLEETGLEVEGVTYFGSQPWPFPHQIMVGFFARRSGGELRVDTTELEEARFFHRDDLPMLPPPISIARKLVDAWLERTKG